MSANSTISALADNQGFKQANGKPNDAVQTAVQTVSQKRRTSKRFQRVANGIFRFKRTGTLYAVFKLNGRTRWKSLLTTDVARARQLLAEEIKNASATDWRKTDGLTIRSLIAVFLKNPMGLAATTFKIRKQLLNVFERTWKYGIEIKISEVKTIMLKSWLAERRTEQLLKTAGVNNYVRMLHGLFQVAVELGAVVESPAKLLQLKKEENPERLTPTWDQAQAIIRAVKGESGKDILSAMLYLGLGQAELANLHGEHVNFESNQIIVRRQKTQRVFTIFIYPQAVPLLEKFKAENRIIPGKPLFERVSPREAISLACNKLGYPQFTPRSFRRAFIVRSLEKGIDPRCVAAWQGHRDATLVLRVYGHIIHSAHNQEMARRLTCG